MKIDHIGLSVEDLPAQINWYEQALGMSLVKQFAIEEPPVSAAFLGGNGIVLELLERSGSTAKPPAASPADALLTRGYGHICFRVPDLAATHRGLVQAGALELMAPQDSPEAGVRMSFVTDPEGNLIELIDESPVQT